MIQSHPSEDSLEMQPRGEDQPAGDRQGHPELRSCLFVCLNRKMAPNKYSDIQITLDEIEAYPFPSRGGKLTCCCRSCGVTTQSSSSPSWESFLLLPMPALLSLALPASVLSIFSA